MRESSVLEHKCQDIVLEYQNVIHLARELKGLGANHLPEKRNRGLSGKDKMVCDDRTLPRFS